MALLSVAADIVTLLVSVCNQPLFQILVSGYRPGSLSAYVAVSFCLSSVYARRNFIVVWRSVREEL